MEVLQNTAKKIRRASFSVFSPSPVNNKMQPYEGDFGDFQKKRSDTMKKTKTSGLPGNPGRLNHVRHMSLPCQNPRPDFIPPLDLEEVIKKNSRNKYRRLPTTGPMSTPSSEAVIRTPFRIPESRRSMLRKFGCYGGFEDSLENGLSEEGEQENEAEVPGMKMDGGPSVKEGQRNVYSLQEFVNHRNIERASASMDHRFLRGMRKYTTLNKISTFASNADGSASAANNTALVNRLSHMTVASTSASSVLNKTIQAKTIWSAADTPPFAKQTVLSTKTLKSSLDRSISIDLSTSPTLFFTFQLFSMFDHTCSKSVSLLVSPVCSYCRKCLVAGCRFTCSCQEDTGATSRPMESGKSNKELKKSMTKYNGELKSKAVDVLKPFVCSLHWVRLPAKLKSDTESAMHQYMVCMDQMIGTCIAGVAGITDQAKQQAYLTAIMDGKPANDDRHNYSSKSSTKHWRRLSRASMRDKKDDKFAVQSVVRSLYVSLMGDPSYRSISQFLRESVGEAMGLKNTCLCKLGT